MALPVALPELDAMGQKVSDEIDRIVAEHFEVRGHMIRNLLLTYYLRDIRGIELVEDRSDPLRTVFYYRQQEVG